MGGFLDSLFGSGKGSDSKGSSGKASDATNKGYTDGLHGKNDPPSTPSWLDVVAHSTGMGGKEAKDFSDYHSGHEAGSKDRASGKS